MNALAGIAAVALSGAALTAKSQLFPGGDPRADKYKVQIDDSRHYRAKSLPRIDSSLAIERF